MAVNCNANSSARGKSFSTLSPRLSRRTETAKMCLEKPKIPQLSCFLSKKAVPKCRDKREILFHLPVEAGCAASPSAGA
jgi:hypothetical protein